MNFDLFGDPIFLAQNIVDGLSRGSVYVLFALGLTLVFGVLDIVNLAHASTFMWCAVVGWLVMSALGLPLAVGLLAAMVVGAFLAFALEVFVFRPLRKPGSERLSPMIASIGASIVLVSLAEAFFGVETRRLPTTAIDPVPLYWGGTDGVRFSWAQILAFAVSLLLIFVLRYFLRKTKAGLALRAVAANTSAATLMGVRVDRVVLYTFLISGALAGAAGVLVSVLTNNIQPAMGAQIELRGLVVVILGGMGSVEGALLGGILLGFLETFTIAYLPSGSDYKDALAFIILFLLLILRPQGLLGTKETSRA